MLVGLLIVLIIGLLITAVASGSSLINTAKITARINDFEKIKISFYIFWSIKGKYPSNINNDGNIGTCNDGGCPDSSIEPVSNKFGEEYANKNIFHQAGSWADLYLEGLLD